MRLLLLFALSILPRIALAESFLLQHLGRDSVVGAVGYAVAAKEDTLSDIARRYDVGYDEIIKANPRVNRWVPGAGTKVVIPHQFVLPDAPRQGIVLNLAELRLYYYPATDGGEAQIVYTFPISIGRMDWKSPLGLTKVAAKERNPAWYPPPSIRNEHAEEGDYLPDYIPGGSPENPLGKYALRLALPRYLIHGTDERKEYGIGMRVTHGCIRMYPEDIEQLFALVPVNTPVRFIDQPVKVGWKGEKLFVEVHAPLEEDEDEFEEYSHLVDPDEALGLVQNALLGSDWDELGKDGLTELKKILARGDGVPAPLAQTKSMLPPARRR